MAAPPLHLPGSFGVGDPAPVSAASPSGSPPPQPLPRSALLHLSGESLGRLKREPARLASSRLRVRDEAQHLATSQYRRFVSASASLGACKEVVGSCDAALHRLVALTEAASSSAHAFSRHAARLLHQQAQHQALSQQQHVVLGLLEVPALISASLSEPNDAGAALDLIDYVSALRKRFPGVGLVQQLWRQAQHGRTQVSAALETRLEAASDLPALLQTVGLLRRAHAGDDVRLRTVFLRSRSVWLDTALQQYQPQQPQQELEQQPVEAVNASGALVAAYLDCSRVHLGEVATQYLAVFAEDRADALLRGWLRARVRRLLAHLAECLPSVSAGSSLANLLDTSMYCGLALAVLACDFRSAIVPLFEHRIVSLLQQRLTAVSAAFTAALHTHHWHLPLSALQKHGIVTDSSTSPSSSLAIGVSVLQYPPLAILVDGIVSSLHDLRECAALSVLQRVVGAVEAVLVQAGNQLAQLHCENEEEPAALHEALHGMCVALVDEVVPLCHAFVRAVFGPHPHTTAEVVALLTQVLPPLKQHADADTTDDDEDKAEEDDDDDENKAEEDDDDVFENEQ